MYRNVMLLLIMTAALGAAERQYWSVVEVKDSTGASNFELLTHAGKDPRDAIDERKDELMLVFAKKKKSTITNVKPAKLTWSVRPVRRCMR